MSPEEVTAAHIVCDAHFSDEMISLSVNISKRLENWAIPYQNITSKESNSDENPTETIQEILEIQQLPNNVFKCDICEEQFSTRSERNDHINQHFTSHQCSDCDKVFIGDRQFEHHKRNRQCDSKLKLSKCVTYECYICHQEFILSLRSLKVHMNRFHPLKAKIKNSTEEYKCTICEKKFANVYIMRWHIDEIHGDVKYSCDICKKVFNRLTNLKIHQLIHQNKMPCKCRICGKSFRTSSAVRLHVRTHTKEKPYKCDICNEKAYSYNTDLKRHKRSAHGIVDKTFSCNLCEKIFYEPKYLRRHTTKVHIQKE